MSSSSQQQILDLLAKLKKGHADVNTLLEQFYADNNRSDSAYAEFNEQLIAVIEEVLASPDWRQNLLTNNSMKPVLRLYDSAIALRQQFSSGQQQAPHESSKPGYRQVYVSLFHVEGQQLSQWQVLLASLERSLAGRPVYGTKEDVMQFIRARPHSLCEAYVEILLPDQDVIDLQRKDIYGSMLLGLKPQAAKHAKVVEFFNNNKCYTLSNEGKLVLKLEDNA